MFQFAIIGLLISFFNFTTGSLPSLIGKTNLTKSSSKIIEEIEREAVPSLGSDSVLGLKFNQESYNELTKAANLKLSKAQENNFAGFDVLMPCCGFKTTVAKFEDNCQCGHHLATYGLIKKMLLSGNFSRDNIQKEIDKWVAYFFPKEAIAKELKVKNLDSPSVERALKNYKPKGGC